MSSISNVEKRALGLGITIPSLPPPQGNYLPAYVSGGFVFTSGMGPVLNGIRHNLGYVGGDTTTEQAAGAARIAVLNALAAIRSVVDSLDQIGHLVRLTGYVRSAPGFCGQIAVMDAASSLLIELFEKRGQHVRSAIGVAELPFGIPVEVELVAEITTANN